FTGGGVVISAAGGPAQRATASLPRGSIDGRFKLTEQGEVLGWKYLLAEIAERKLETTASGVGRASLEAAGVIHDLDADVTKYEEAFAEVAETSLQAYREL